MGLPPASPRFKFVHTHPSSGGGSVSGSPAVPRRPPRQQLPSPSARSRSLELLDQDEEERKSSISAIVQTRPPLPRPRSRSLDGLLDEDVKSSGGESCKQNKQCEKNKSHLSCNSEEGGKTTNSLGIVTSKYEPIPVPRMKPKAIECMPEAENTRILSNDSDKEASVMRLPKPSRRSFNTKEQLSTTFDKRRVGNQERRMEAGTTQEKLITNDENEDDDADNDHDRSTMLKTRSCGAGLDSDGSVSSSEYSKSGDLKKGPGSLLSLPTGVEPKRKRNFMDKCVNKVRSFIRK